MSCIIHNIEQGTPEWKQLRCGLFTCSNLKDLFMGKSTKGYSDAITKIAYEKMTGELTPETYQNDAMRRGTELEPEARLWYEMETFNKVHQVGFIQPNDELKDWCGYSPDGLISTNGLLEIKCPLYNTHISYLLDKKLPSNYFYQVHGGLYMSEREYLDFVSYHPTLPKFQMRIERDEKVIKDIKEKLLESIEAVEKIMKRITQ